MVLTTTFNNMSAILGQSVLLMGKTEVPGKNHGPATGHLYAVSHNFVSNTPSHERDSNSQL
jgi:hypothetical protein